MVYPRNDDDNYRMSKSECFSDYAKHNSASSTPDVLYSDCSVCAPVPDMLQFGDIGLLINIAK